MLSCFNSFPLLHTDLMMMLHITRKEHIHLQALCITVSLQFHPEQPAQ